jgi:hypothetical protein
VVRKLSEVASGSPAHPRRSGRGYRDTRSTSSSRRANRREMVCSSCPWVRVREGTVDSGCAHVHGVQQRSGSCRVMRCFVVGDFYSDPGLCSEAESYQPVLIRPRQTPAASQTRDSACYTHVSGSDRFTSVGLAGSAVRACVNTDFLPPTKFVHPGARSMMPAKEMSKPPRITTTQSALLAEQLGAHSYFHRVILPQRLPVGSTVRFDHRHNGCPAQSARCWVAGLASDGTGPGSLHLGGQNHYLVFFIDEVASGSVETQ